MCISLHELRKELLPLLPERGSMWPNDMEAEAIVLGHLISSLMASPGVYELSPDDFYGHSHGGIFNVLVKCRLEKQGPVSQKRFLDMAHKCGYSGLSAMDFLTLSSRVPTIYKPEPYVLRVKKFSWLRNTLRELRHIDALLRACPVDEAEGHFEKWMNGHK